MNHKSINVGGNVDRSNLTIGDSVSSFNPRTEEKNLGELMEELSGMVQKLEIYLSPEHLFELQEDLERFKAEACRKKPSPKWYSLSAKGLIDAAKSVGSVGEPIIKLVYLISQKLEL